MATVSKATKQDDRKTRLIGRAWKNVIRDGKNAGIEYLTIKLDSGVKVSFDDQDFITLWPNDNKRTGINPRTNKSFQDADYRLGVKLPV